MRLLSNVGQDRVLDHLRRTLLPGGRLSLVTPALSLFAFRALHPELAARAALLARLDLLASPQAPSLAYHLMLFHFFGQRGDELDEERIIKGLPTAWGRGRCSCASRSRSRPATSRRSETGSSRGRSNSRRRAKRP